MWLLLTILYGILDLAIGAIIYLPLSMIKLVSKKPLDETLFRVKPNVDRAILLIHGSGASEIQFMISRKIIDNIMKKEGKVYRVYSCDLSNTYIHDRKLGIEDYVTVASKYLVEISRRDNLREVVVIGHSMGGLVAAELASKHYQVKKVITIGTPLNGAPLLKTIGGCKPTKRHKQMTPGSEYLKKLKDTILVAKYPLLCIGAEYDFQVPKQYAHMYGMMTATNMAVPFSHVTIILAPSTWEKIFSYLD
jgi:pimeloyl-ACP methyl ester carboxylesterase